MIFHGQTSYSQGSVLKNKSAKKSLQLGSPGLGGKTSKILVKAGLSWDGLRLVGWA